MLACPAAKVKRSGYRSAMDDPNYRRDQLNGGITRIVPARQDRPNLPASDCPFCPGGQEASGPYEVLAFPNRWPPLPEGHAEVVLYTSDHDASFAQLSEQQARRVVDLWAERTTALSADPSIAYVLIFENRGAEVGATISHPHGQIYAFEIVPPAVNAEQENVQQNWHDCPDAQIVIASPHWKAWVPTAAMWPYELIVVPQDDVFDLPSLNNAQRNDLANVLREITRRYDALFTKAMPYMMWIHQKPTQVDIYNIPVHFHFAPIWRAPQTARFVAAGELGSGIWFNPIDPAAAAAQLREL